jgi:hypothetical protein
VIFHQPNDRAGLNKTMSKKRRLLNEAAGLISTSQFFEIEGHIIGYHALGILPVFTLG